MVGKLRSFWEGLFSGAMLVSGRAINTNELTNNSTIWTPHQLLPCIHVVVVIQYAFDAMIHFSTSTFRFDALECSLCSDDSQGCFEVAGTQSPTAKFPSVFHVYAFLSSSEVYPKALSPLGTFGQIVVHLTYYASSFLGPLSQYSCLLWPYICWLSEIWSSKIVTFKSSPQQTFKLEKLSLRP